MLKFCPECGSKVTGGKFCGNCGADLTKYGAGSADSAVIDASTTLDDALINLVGFANEKQADAQRRDKLRVMIIRGQYDEAKAVCNELIDSDPMDSTGYIGLIRIASNNYKEFEGEEIAEQIRIAEEVFFGSDKLGFDLEYAKYIAARKKYFEDKAAAAERKRKEAEYEMPVEQPGVAADTVKEPVAEEPEQPVAESPAAAAERIRKEAKEAELADFKFTDNGDDTYTITGVRDKSVERIIIPNSVTSIGENAFNGCSCLTSIEIPGNVTSIGKSAFYGCSSLTSITIPNRVTCIEDNTFFNCVSLTSITIPNGVAIIGRSAFGVCGSLESVVIPNSVISIVRDAFWNCVSLTSVDIPDSVTYIGIYAFDGCSSLTSVSVPSGCEIGYAAFPDTCNVIKR